MMPNNGLLVIHFSIEPHDARQTRKLTQCSRVYAPDRPSGAIYMKETVELYWARQFCGHSGGSLYVSGMAQLWAGLAVFSKKLVIGHPVRTDHPI